MADANINVLMLGPRRAGKSSVLSAMLRSLKLQEEKTGFRLEADQDTLKVMQRRLTDLEKLFVLHANRPDEPFSTILGQEDGEQYSEFTDEAIQYSFDFHALNKHNRLNRKVGHKVVFTDIPGERMLSELKAEGNGVVDRFIKSNAVIVAVDAPALMEGRIRPDEGVGEFHTFANIPDTIYNVVSVSDATMRSNLKPDQKIVPKLVMFVPLKCEKYYHAGEMELLRERVRNGYKSTFDFLASRDEYTVAITPILTLGDIVFDHYETEINTRGREVVKRFSAQDPRGIARMPNALYRMRAPGCNDIAPLFCEQPLLYLEGYILGLDNYLKKAMKKAERDNRDKTVMGKVVKAAKHMFWIVMFGIYYLIFKGIEALVKDESLMEAIKKTIGNLKASGDGYEIVQDNLGIKELKETYSK